ncbi:MAG: hypothetical protein U1F57_05805 [bacterium]
MENPEVCNGISFDGGLAIFVLAGNGANASAAAGAPVLVPVAPGAPATATPMAVTAPNVDCLLRVGSHAAACGGGSDSAPAPVAAPPPVAPALSSGRPHGSRDGDDGLARDSCDRSSASSRGGTGGAASFRERILSVEQRLADLEAYVNNSARVADDPKATVTSKVSGSGPGHNGWMMTCAALVLFMTLPGLRCFTEACPLEKRLVRFGSMF